MTVVMGVVAPLSVANLPQDTSRFVRAGAWVIAVGFLGFMAWAALAPLDQGVPVPGTMMVEGQRKTLHHPTGAQVERSFGERRGCCSGWPVVDTNERYANSQPGGKPAFAVG